MYYRSFNDVMKERFGKKVYRLALDIGMTCPNRDGTVGYGGCTFCRHGSGSFAAGGEDISQKIESAKAKVSAKNPEGLYMAYFQSYTNTYAPAQMLRNIFLSCAKREDICALSIATRPDCLGDDIIDVLKEIKTVKPLMVELGLQTIHEKTAMRINRCFPLDAYDKSVAKLRAAGIESVVHMIIGLPGEDSSMAVATARYIADSGADGIKFHLLHVLRDTVLYEEYKSCDFKTLSMDEYIGILEECIRVIRPNMTVHRLTGDGDKRYLVSPMWSADKKRVLNEIHRRFRMDDVIQGEKYTVQGKGTDYDGQKIC